MVKVLTYGTYDLLHHGHVKLLERAKALGDYLIVGVTSDDFDTTRGKINNKQSLSDRMASVAALGIADEIIVEEYEGQKIDDIKKYDVDIFTVGSDWVGKFDYLNEYCHVIYLPRTAGISSTELRAEERKIKIKIEGDSQIANKFINECSFVNGVEITKEDDCDAYYFLTTPNKHYAEIKEALLKGKHVLCESPVTLSKAECEELYSLASEKKLVLMDAIKTSYSTAFNRMLLLVKGGNIGDVISIDATCTSMQYSLTSDTMYSQWNSITAWGPTALLPIFQLLGTEYKNVNIYSKYIDKDNNVDGFTKIDFVYPHSVASIKVAKSAKSEGSLVITGTNGYVYIPAPWWKTDYFEIRYENHEKNKRYFYQLDGEGIRNEIVAFAKCIQGGKDNRISQNLSSSIAGVIEEFEKGNVIEL